MHSKGLNAVYANLVYDTIEVYSYCRGELPHLGSIREQYQVKEPFKVEILDIQERLHPTARLLHTCDKHDKFTEQLHELFSLNSEAWILSRCLPTYRDAVIFKQKNKTVEAISICFQCYDVQAYQNGHLLASEEFYKGYAQLLASIGHDVQVY